MTATAGEQLRTWRQRRRYSQLELSAAAEVSAKHLSYVETGRSRPSPEMVVHLCEHLEVPVRARNDILVAAGHAPRFPETPFDPTAHDDLAELLRLVVDGHRYPVLAVDAAWNLLTANDAAMMFLTDVAQELLEPPVNVVRISLHAQGLAPRIANFAEYASHMLRRLRRLQANHPQSTVASLIDEFGHLAKGGGADPSALALPLELLLADGTVARLISTSTTFGAPHDITLAELALESFYPADPESKAALDRWLT